LKFAAFGRTHWLYDAVRLAIARGHEVVLIGTCASAPEYKIRETDFERLARELHCPFFNDVRINNEKYLQLARSSGAAIALSVNWSTLIGADMIGMFPYGILNAHAGDLPRYRGNACPNWAILAGEDHVGVCVHLMIPELDAGPVVLRSRFPLTENTYISDVYAFLDQEVPRLLVDGMEGLARGALRPEPQPDDPALVLRCFPRRPEDGLIDWRQAAVHICRLVRASARPFAGAFTYLEGRRLTIWRARVQKLQYNWMGVPGQIIAVDRNNGEVAVLAGQDAVVLEEVESEGQVIAPTALIRSTRMRLGLDPVLAFAGLREALERVRRAEN
jgi:methionyl-tRNA formyltransferase